MGGCNPGQERTEISVAVIVNRAPSTDAGWSGVPKASALGSNACGPVTNNCVSLGKQKAMTSPHRFLIGSQTTVTGGLDRDSIAINLCNKYSSPLKNCSSEITLVGGQYMEIGRAHV